VGIIGLNNEALFSQNYFSKGESHDTQVPITDQWNVVAHGIIHSRRLRGSDQAASARVGSKNCTDSCHASTQDITGTPITSAWSGTTTPRKAACSAKTARSGEGSPGDRSHSIPEPQAAQCNACHGLGGFNSTFHANPNPYNGSNLTTFTGPDKFFFQGDASNSGPAEIMGVPEFFPDGVTPVTHAQHIQECSVCHNPNQRFIFKVTGRLQSGPQQSAGSA